MNNWNLQSTVVSWRGVEHEVSVDVCVVMISAWFFNVLSTTCGHLTTSIAMSQVLDQDCSTKWAYSRRYIWYSVSVHIFHLNIVIGKEGFLDVYLERLRFCFQTSKIKEGTAKAVSHIHSFLRILDSLWEHAGKERFEEDRCKHTALLHSISNHKRGWCISAVVSLTFISLRKSFDDVDKFPLATTSLQHCPKGFSIDCVEGFGQVNKDYK